MPTPRPEKHVKSEQLPPLASEDHTCAQCALAYAEISIEDALSMEPMFNDLRARRFRYNDCDVEATLG